ncbi:BaeS Signal transduction histidine kinase [Comamonadaceae bacterium]
MTQHLTLERYEEKAFALYLVNDIRYPYISVTVMSAVSAWLMYGRVANWVIALWIAAGIGASALREAFVRHMKPKLAQDQGHTTILRGFAVSSFMTGVIWAVFFVLYIDTSDPVSVLVVGSYVAGHVGGVVTLLAFYLPAFYLFVLPVVLPSALILAASDEPVYWALSLLTFAFLFSMSGYAHITNRLHRESMRLRFDNQRLIADLEQRNAEVEKTSRNKSLFLAGVSHDLKQPIRAIGMYTGFLRHSTSKGLSPSVVLQTADKIETAASAVHRQISRLLELSRLESGSMPVQLEALNLHDVLKPVHELLSSEAHTRRVQLRFAAGCSRQVWADRRMLESILINFISNAIKHAEGRRVYVGTRVRTSYPEGQRLCIEVRDGGTGIAAYQLPWLFEAYQSFDDRAASESHGLGLAIAKAQATYLGCEIDVRSQLGCGSTFTLCGLRSAEMSP